MPVQSEALRFPLGEFRERILQQLIPLNTQFSYFFATPPQSEDDVREYLEEPIAALPPLACKALPNVSIVLVPFLERANGKEKREEFVCFEKPAENRLILEAWTSGPGGASLFLSVQDQDMADYHYRLYHLLAGIASQSAGAEQMQDYFSLLREELSAGVNGEVDEQSWHLKQNLRRRQTNMRRDTKGFREYAQASFVDTLTLYLHGICCDIDVETGPRQLPSRYLRRRLELLTERFPAPDGYAVFPEDLDKK